MPDIIFFSAGQPLQRKGNICNCPCHQGKPGHFHCWEDCCDLPNVIWSAVSLKEAIRESLARESDD